MSERDLYDVFLSHNSHDKPLVEQIAQRLVDEAKVRPFLDKWHLIPGVAWQPELEETLRRSKTVAVFIGPSGNGPWHHEEMQVALMRAVREKKEFRVIPVLLSEADTSSISDFLQLRTWVDFSAGTNNEIAFKRLVAGVLGHATEFEGITLPDEPAPYRGLMQFKPEHARFFFGRDQDIGPRKDEKPSLIDKLRTQRFVAVVGSSGSGKSSIVGAGLLPRLEKDAIPGSRNWRNVTFTPADDPWRSLAVALASSRPPEQRGAIVTYLLAQLDEPEAGLRHTLETWFADTSEPLLLFVDQFEELFTHAPNTRTNAAARDKYDERIGRFVRQLAHEVLRPDGRFRVVITLRADFMPHCLRMSALKELLQDRVLYLGELATDEAALREVIQRPAQEVGAMLETGLMEVLLADVRRQTGALPLLEDALSELWRKRRGPWLTLTAYNDPEFGGISGALKNRADRIFNGLSGSHQRIARRIFVKLTSLEEDTENTRRRVDRKALYAETTDSAEIDVVINVLAGPDARLIVADAGWLSIAHETLIQNWPRLRTWLSEDRQLERIHRELERAANEWDAKARSKRYLFHATSAKLAETEEHAPALADRTTPFEREFLTACRQERDTENRRFRRNSRIAVGVAIFTLAVSLVALYEWSAAETERGKAEAQLLEARNNLGLAFLERANKFRTEEKYAHAFLTAGRAIGFDGCGGPLDGFPTLLRSDTENFLRASTIAKHCLPHTIWPDKVLETENDRIFGGLAIHPHGRLLAAEGAARQIHIWNIETGQIVQKLNGYEGVVVDVEFSPDGSTLASSHLDGTIRLWNLSSNEFNDLVEHKGVVHRIKFSPSGKLLASSGADNSAHLWDVENGICRHHLSDFQDEVQGVAFSPDETLLVMGSGDGQIHIHESGTGHLVTRFLAHSSRIWSIAFHPNGNKLATASGDRQVKVWDLSEALAKSPPSSRATLTAHKDQVYRVAYSTDGLRLATASWDGTVRLWDASTMQPVATLDAHNGSVDGLAFFPGDSTHMASAGKGSQIRLWRIPMDHNGPLYLAGHAAPVDGLCYHPDGKRLASGSWDKSIRLWELKTGRSTLLYSHVAYITALEFDRTGERLYASGNDGHLFSIRIADGQVAMKAHDTASGWIADLALSPDGELVATAGEDGKVRVWDVSSEKLIKTLTAHSLIVLSISFTVDGGRIVTSGKDGKICVWDRKSWNKVRTVRVHETHKREQDVGSIVAPDSQHIVSAGSDGKVCITEIGTGTTVTTLTGVNEPYNLGLAITRDMKRLAVTCSDRTVRIWDVKSKRQLEIMAEDNQYLYDLALSPDDRRLAYPGENGTIRFLDMRPREVPPLDPSRFHFDGLDVVFGQIKPHETSTP